MRISEVTIYAGVLIMILFLGMSFFLKNGIIRELITAFSIIIGAIVLKKLDNQKNK